MENDLDPNNLPGGAPPQPKNEPTPPATTQINPTVISPSTPSNPDIAATPTPSVSSISPTPIAQPTPNGTFGGDSAGGFQPSSQKTIELNQNNNHKKRSKLIMLILVIVLIVGVSAFVFAIYIPNKPSNVWNTGVNRSGEVLEELIAKATEQDKIQKLENSQLTASIKGNAGSLGDISGELDLKFNQTKQDGVFNFDIKGGAQDISLAIKYISEISEGNKLPDIFVNLSGFKSLGFDALLPGISDYDGKWIEIDSEYLETQFGSLFQGDDSDFNTTNLTAQEISALSTIVTKVSSEYVFSTDADKAVLVNKEYLGKEDVEGVSSYHYKVGINADNAVAFCKDLTTQLYENEGFKKILGSQSDAKYEDMKKSAIDSCDDLKDNVKPDETFDAWIGSKYKLINRIRLYDDGNSEKYLDIGQNFAGGDEIPFYIDFSNLDKSISAGRITMTANLKTFESKGDLVIKTESEGENLDLTANITFKPITEDITITKPTNSTSIQDVIKKLGLSDAIPSVTGVQGVNTDNEFDLYRMLFGTN